MARTIPRCYVRNLPVVFSEEASRCLFASTFSDSFAGFKIAQATSHWLICGEPLSQAWL